MRWTYTSGERNDSFFISCRFCSLRFYMLGRFLQRHTKRTVVVRSKNLPSIRRNKPHHRLGTLFHTVTNSQDLSIAEFGLRYAELLCGSRTATLRTASYSDQAFRFWILDFGLRPSIELRTSFANVGGFFDLIQKIFLVFGTLIELWALERYPQHLH